VAQQKKPSPLQRGAFVRVAGTPVSYTIERNPDASRTDHLTMTVRAGEFGVVAIALSTYSLRSLDAGCDPRIRLAIIESNLSALPSAGVSPSAGLDYSILEAQNAIVYREYERSALESLLIEKISRAVLIEGWGEFYVRSHIGIHQVHSRRASGAVQTNYVGRDGALRFYFNEHRVSELLLFKFSGQL
jgi:hypothetical protein